MKYRVSATIEFNAKMTIEADSLEDAERKADDRLLEGALDGFELGEATGDYEAWKFEEIK